MHDAPEPVSPELVLVSPELRERAVALEQERPGWVEDAPLHEAPPRTIQSADAVAPRFEVPLGPRFEVPLGPRFEMPLHEPSFRQRRAWAAAIAVAAVAAVGAVAAWRSLGGTHSVTSADSSSARSSIQDVAPALGGGARPAAKTRGSTRDRRATSKDKRAQRPTRATGAARTVALAPRPSTRKRSAVRPGRPGVSIPSGGHFRVSADGFRWYVVGLDPDVACGRGVVTPLPMQLGRDGRFGFTGPVRDGPQTWRVSIHGRLVGPRRARGTFRLRGSACDTGVRRFTAAAES